MSAQAVPGLGLAADERGFIPQTTATMKSGDEGIGESE